LESVGELPACEQFLRYAKKSRCRSKPYSVRYEAVNAMLLNEFLREHKKAEAQSAQVDAIESELHATKSQAQGKEIAELETALKQQAAQLQKESARLEANTPAARLVDNP
jgi:hypothetical protein